MTAPASAAVVICRCGHGQRLHPDETAGSCIVSSCGCAEYRQYPDPVLICPDCSSAYTTQAFLDKHRAEKHTPKPPPAAPVNGTRVPTENICPKCGRGFDSVNSLNGHLSGHARGEKTDQPPAPKPAPTPGPARVGAQTPPAGPKPAQATPAPPAAPAAPTQPAAQTVAAPTATPTQIRAGVDPKPRPIDPYDPVNSTAWHTMSMYLDLGAWGTVKIETENLATPEFCNLLDGIRGFLTEAMELGSG